MVETGASLVRDVVDHLARIDGDDVRGRVVRERDGGAACARQVAAPESAVVVENE